MQESIDYLRRAINAGIFGIPAEEVPKLQEHLTIIEHAMTTCSSCGETIVRAGQGNLYLELRWVRQQMIARLIGDIMDEGKITKFGEQMAAAEAEYERAKAAYFSGTARD